MVNSDHYGSLMITLRSKFGFISKLDIKLGVADWNICFIATPSALKQQAFTGIYVCGHK